MKQIYLIKIFIDEILYFKHFQFFNYALENKVNYTIY